MARHPGVGGGIDAVGLDFEFFALGAGCALNARLHFCALLGEEIACRYRLDLIDGLVVLDGSLKRGNLQRGWFALGFEGGCVVVAGTKVGNGSSFHRFNAV